VPGRTCHRRVKGLRREEVAMLAGVSAEYYARMERGSLSGASEAVLDSLARALRFDDAERAHRSARPVGLRPGGAAGEAHPGRRRCVRPPWR
jgi:transcriptional regulator with XRE-family HTH domain